ncbi:hypothetical protein PE066_07105 [Ramlibacter tataouinensis]|uniref:hypothetical protein n=1 Tax=Ramlibacter tataouinensis TaxID=94132 RepID=UPI0022F3F10D|nr:hypothetical protein [Ramlibacter tataouinensis]WBY04092.1 hypothetical protein PE066_07105 [Ramlibacter tataouinensis]
MEQRVQALDAKFLAAQIAAETAAPLTFVPDLDQLAAFRLLVHAEIEDFLELKAKESLNAARAKIATPGCNLWELQEIFVVAVILGRSLTIGSPFDRAKLLANMDACIGAALDEVSKNNGIKSESFFMLAGFAGKAIDQFPSLSVSLTSYGKTRGDVAHKSVARVSTILAPSAESAEVKSVLEGLKAFFYGP